MATIISGTMDRCFTGTLPLAQLITLTSTLILDITKIKPHPIIVFNCFYFSPPQSQKACSLPDPAPQHLDRL